MIAVIFGGFAALVGFLFLCVILVVAIFDVTQKKHAILRNFPVLGRFRYLIERVGPEFRQYIVARNDEERPYSRDERSWVYASAKRENNYFGFGTDNDLVSDPNYLIIKHSVFPLDSPHQGQAGYDPQYRIPCGKVLGSARGRKKAFRPDSVINVSGMSFGSLSSVAVEALNRGCKIAGCIQSSGEGSVSPYHNHGGELIWQIGTGYFGCRDADGGFSMDGLLETVEKYPTIRAIEIKLSQGAKPGAGGILPKSKITPEIASIRGIPMDRDCISPASHKQFHDADSLLDFAESIADRTGMPVGIKSAVGELSFWFDLAGQMKSGTRGLDFINIDGGEGGTGAAPLVFSDHVSLPFRQGFARVRRIFMENGLDEDVVFFGAGRLGLPQTALFAFALGCDMINVGRTAMLAVGCIQAQKCQTNHCPTGVATQKKWLMRGLDPEDKSARLANYVITLRKELLALSRACGAEHPGLVAADRLEILNNRFGPKTMNELFGWDSDRQGTRSEEYHSAVKELMKSLSS